MGAAVGHNEHFSTPRLLGCCVLVLLSSGCSSRGEEVDEAVRTELRAVLETGKRIAGDRFTEDTSDVDCSGVATSSPIVRFKITSNETEVYDSLAHELEQRGWTERYVPDRDESENPTSDWELSEMLDLEKTIEGERLVLRIRSVPGDGLWITAVHPAGDCLEDGYFLIIQLETSPLAR